MVKCPKLNCGGHVHYTNADKMELDNETGGIKRWVKCTKCGQQYVVNYEPS